MKTTAKPGDKPQKGEFEKVEGIQCLYRYSSNKVYYALVKHEGKQKRQSLKTVILEEAKRKLRDLQVDLGKVDASQGRLTLEELCNRYLATIQNQAPATVRRKTDILNRLKADFPAGKGVQVAKIKPSEVQTWVARYNFGYASHNLCVECVRAIFRMAVADKVLIASPASELKRKKVTKPVRTTPSFEDFKAIIADVRKQQFNAEAEKSADFLEFMGLLGVGQAEIAGLKRQHVNLKTKQITFFRVKTRTPYVVPIFPQAEVLVQKLVSDPEMAQTDHLFRVNIDKTHHTQGTSTRDGKKALAAACRRLGLPAHSQRALRRMFITRCIEKGIDVKVIAQWQGHQDGGKLILGTYSHVRNTHAEEMAKLLTV
jgi:integrase